MRAYVCFMLLFILFSYFISNVTTEEELVQVKVVDELGRPLSMASVSVTKPRPAASLLGMFKTDINGIFFLSVEPGTPLVIDVEWMGVIVAEAFVNADPKGVVVNASVRDLKVGIVDQKRRLVTDCEVSIEWRSPLGRVSTSRSTNENGFVVFERFPSSTQLELNMSLRVQKFGVDIMPTFNFNPKDEGWNLTLNCELYDLQLLILDRERSPVAGAVVEISSGSKRVFKQSDERGLMSIVQLPAGIYDVKVTFESYRQSVQVLVENDSSIVITLPFVRSYNVTLLFRWDDGRPGSGLNMLLKGGPKDTKIEVTTDASGASSFSLYPGVYNVSIRKDSSNLRTFKLEVRADTRVEFTLNSSLRLNELTIRLSSDEGRVVDGTVLVSRDGVKVSSASTSGGSTKLLLSDGLYKVVAQVQGYDVTEAEISLNSDQEVELKLSPTPSPLSSPIVSIAIVACVALVTFVVARSLFSKK